MENTNDKLTDLNIECNNLFHLTKLLVKDILRTAVKLNRQLDEDNPLIIQLIRVLEAVTLHGLKPRKLLNSLTVAGLSNIDPWPMITDTLKNEKCTDIIESVQQMGLKSGISKFRAWIKLALMQKQLGEYFRLLTEQSGLGKLNQYYFPAAILLNDKGIEISGLLVGLSVIECNFYKFRETLPESESSTILNFSRYMQNEEIDYGSLEIVDDECNSETIKKLLDDKNYTEELNSVLQTKLQKLQHHSNKLEKDAELCKMNLAEMKNKNLCLNEELERARAEMEQIKQQYQHKTRLIQDDLEVERNTYQTSRQELYQQTLELEKQVKKEQQLREEAERNLTKEDRKKGDMKNSMESLEKQLDEKQQVIHGVRQQLEQVKAGNLELNKELQSRQKMIDQKNKLNEKLEEKCAGQSQIIDQMNNRIEQIKAEKACVDNILLNLQEENQHLLQTKAEESAEKELLISRIEEISKELDKAKEDKADLFKEYEALQKQLEFLEKENRRIKIECQEQVEALAEMAKVVENSKLESEGLREMQVTIQEAKWKDDKDVLDCNQCSKAFNVSRRKHHCRRCGGVFCHDCSSNRMPLASSSKPMRVCDTCLNALMKTYTFIASETINSSISNQDD